MRILFLFLFSLINANLSLGQKRYFKDIHTDKVTINYSDHTIIAEYIPVKWEFSTEPSKTYYWYSARQIHATQGGYSGQILNGSYTDFYNNKNLKEQGEFKHGLKHGEWLNWWENGKLKSIEKWYKGNKTGRYFKFDSAGIVKETGKYRNGALSGKVKTFVIKDSIQVNRYKSGELVIEKAKKEENNNKEQDQESKALEEKPESKKERRKKKNNEGGQPEKSANSQPI